MSTSYKHQPLPSSHHIRLLEFPGYTDENEPLKGTLRVVDVEEASLPYVALSYTWGQPNFSQDLLLDGGKVFRITPILAAALRRFRYASALRWIWVDAICINQQDDAEKTTQIPLMADIYRGASRVMVWLGGRDQDADLLRKIKRLVSTMLDPYEDDEFASRLLSGLHQLAQLPWFGRRWIIQELALNPNVVLCCGEAEIPWAHLAPALQLIDDKSADLQNVRLLWDLWRDIAMPVITKYQDRFLQTIMGHRDIAALMKSCSAFECLDGRDRIAALLGISTDTRRGFTVNYADSVEETFLAFAAKLARSGHMAWLINQSLQRKAGLADQEQILPSWVPDWMVAVPRHGRISESETNYYKKVPCDIQMCPTNPRLHVLTAKFPKLEESINALKRVTQKYRQMQETFDPLPVPSCKPMPKGADPLPTPYDVYPAPLQVVWKSVLLPENADLVGRMTLILVDLWPWAVARMSEQEEVSRRITWLVLVLRLFYCLTGDFKYPEEPTEKIGHNYRDYPDFDQDINDLEKLRIYLTVWVTNNAGLWNEAIRLPPVSRLVLCRQSSQPDALTPGVVCAMGRLQFTACETVDIGDKVLLADLGYFQIVDGRATFGMHDCRYIVREHPASDVIPSHIRANERDSLDLLDKPACSIRSQEIPPPVAYEFLAPCELFSVFLWGEMGPVLIDDDSDADSDGYPGEKFIPRGSEVLSIQVR